MTKLIKVKFKVEQAYLDPS